MLSDILRQVSDRRRRVIVNFEAAAYDLASNWDDNVLNEVERYKISGISIAD